MGASTLPVCLFLALCLQVFSNIIPPISLRTLSVTDSPPSCFSRFKLSESEPRPDPPMTQLQEKRGILDKLVRKMLYYKTSGEDLTQEVHHQIEHELFFLANNFWRSFQKTFLRHVPNTLRTIALLWHVADMAWKQRLTPRSLRRSGPPRRRRTRWSVDSFCTL